MNTGAKRSYSIAIAGGAVAWLLTMAVSDRSEAWDSPVYWSVTYPACIALAAALAYFTPERPWRWALSIMLVQPFVMTLTSGGSFGLLPLGLLLFGVLAIPPLVAARAAAWLRCRLGHPS
jgi:hypothetical protein